MSDGAMKRFIEVEYAELHTPLFLAGTNLQQKLDRTKRHDLGMVFDEEKKRLLVTLKGKTANIPEAAVACWIEGHVKIADMPTMPFKSPMTAQVATPQSHVHAGPGAGKTGKQ